MELLKQATHIAFVLATLPKFVQIADFFVFFFTDDSLKIKKSLELVSRSYLLKLAKFHH